MTDVVAEKAASEVFLDAAQLAARYPVPITKKGVYRLVNEGRLEDIVTRIGRYRTFRLDRVLEWEAAGGIGLDDDPPRAMEGGERH